MEVQGWVVVGLTLILLGYLVPHLVRSRRLLLDSRLEDRFSASLRILPIVAAERGGPVGGPVGGPHHVGEVSRPYLHRRRTEAVVKRPTTRTARAVADARVLAAARAARAGEVSRRAAAARRRLILTLLLVGVAAASWSGVGLTSLAWWVAAAPTVVLAGVLVAGRRAAVAGRRRDAAARKEMALLEAQLRAVEERVVAAPAGSRVVAAAPRPAVESHTVEEERSGRRVEQPPDTAPAAEILAEPTPGHGTEVVSERGAAIAGPSSSVPPPEPADDVPMDPAGAGEARRADTPQAERADTPQAGSGEPGRPWTPVAVPPPAYTLKPSTRRRDVAPFEVAAHTASAVPARPGAPVVTPSAPAVAEPAVSGCAVAADPLAAGEAPAGLVQEAPAGLVEEAPAVTAEAPGIDLDAVLRRRAEGA